MLHVRPIDGLSKSKETATSPRNRRSDVYEEEGEYTSGRRRKGDEEDGERRRKGDEEDGERRRRSSKGNDDGDTGRRRKPSKAEEDGDYYWRTGAKL